MYDITNSYTYTGQATTYIPTHMHAYIHMTFQNMFILSVPNKHGAGFVTFLYVGPAGGAKCKNTNRGSRMHEQKSGPS